MREARVAQITCTDQVLLLKENRNGESIDTYHHSDSKNVGKFPPPPKKPHKITSSLPFPDATWIPV